MRLNLTKVRIWLLKAIILSLPFGGIPLTPLPYTQLVLVLIYVYLAVFALDQLKRGGHFTLSPIAMLPLAMWAVFALSTVINEMPGASSADSLIRQILFYAVFLIPAIPDARRIYASGDSPLKYLVAATLLMALAFVAEHGLVFEADRRLSLEYINANVFAMYSVISFFIILDAKISRTTAHIPGKLKPYLLPFAIVLFSFVGLSGSRGGIVIAAIAGIAYFTMHRRLSIKVLPMFLSSAFALVLGIVSLMTQDFMSDRLSEIGQDIRITEIWPAGMEIFLSHPIIGAGFSKSEVLISEALGRDIALHNEFLKIATAGGVAAIVLFSLFSLALVRRAFVYRNVSGSPLFIVLMLSLLLYLAKGGGALQFPFVWVIFATVGALPLFGKKQRASIRKTDLGSALQ